MAGPINIDGVLYEDLGNGHLRVVGYASAPASQGKVFTLPQSPKEQREQARQDAADRRAEAADRRAEQSAAREAEKFAREDTMAPPPGDTSKSGEEYLATLPGGPNGSLANQVRALADGRRAMPTGTALRSPMVQQLVAAASQFDPTLDAANAATRVATRKDFTSGKSAQNITAINTALGHLGTLSKAAEGLNNRSIRPWNSIANLLETQSGDPRVKTFGIARDAVANELMRVFRQTGASTTEVEEWKKTIDSSDSPEQLRGEISKAVELLNSRLEALGAQYNQGLGKSADPISLLNPHAQAVFNALGPGGNGTLPPDEPPKGPPSNPLNDPNLRGGPGLEAASGATRSEFSPRQAGMVDAMINAGASKAMIDAALKKQGFGPIRADDLAAAKQWMKANPGQRYFGAQITKEVPLTAFQTFAGSAPGAALAHATDAGTAGLVGAMSGEQGRGALDAMSALHPDASLAGDVAGGIGGAAGLEAGVAARAPVALSRYAPRIADAIYGGLTGFNQAPEGQGGYGAALGAAAGLGGGIAGDRALRGVGAVAKGVTDPAVNYLRGRGIPLTVGQALSGSGPVGNLVRGAEDRLSGFWGIGDVVKARQREGVEAVADRMANDAVAPIGGTASGYGEPAVNDILQQGSDAYKAATAGANVPLDPQFATDMAQIRALGGTLPDDLSQRFGKALENRIAPVEADTQLTGDTFQQAVRGLKGYRAEATKPGFEQDYRNYLGKGIDALKDQMRRGGGSDVVDALADADKAWRQIKVVEKATQAARNGARSGEIGLPMPSQFNDAATAAANKYGGPRFNAELIDAAQRVLPNKVPDSGTAGRLGLGALLGGGVGVGGGAGALAGDTQAGAETGLGTILLLAAGGSRPAQQAMTSLLLKRPQAARTIGEILARNSGIGGTVGAGTLPFAIGN